MRLRVTVSAYKDDDGTHSNYYVMSEWVIDGDPDVLAAKVRNAAHELAVATIDRVMYVSTKTEGR